MKTLIQQFGFNAIKGRKLGLSVQEVANINKDTAILFGLTEGQAEQVVTLWVRECQLADIMNGDLVS